MYTLAHKKDGTVWTWGANFNYALGDGTNVSRPVPAAVPGLGGAVALASAGEDTTAVVKGDGSVWAWGVFAVGDGTTGVRASPVQVKGENGFGTLSLGPAAPFKAIAPVVVTGSTVSVTATATFPPQFVGKPIVLSMEIMSQW